MKPGLYTIDQNQFCFDAGDLFELKDNSYMLEICDICGKKRKCDWLEYKGPEYKTGMDVCRECQKEILKDVNEDLKDVFQKALENNHKRAVWLTETYATSPNMSYDEYFRQLKNIAEGKE